MLKHFYHYTASARWSRIQSTDARRDGYVGLVPKEGLINPVFNDVFDLPKQAFAPVIHGFIDQDPQAWYQQPLPQIEGAYSHPRPNAFEAFMGNAGQGYEWIVLKATLRPEDEAFVIDYGSHLPYMAGAYNPPLPERFERAKNLWDSRIPAADFMPDMAKDMTLPQTICFSRIPVNRIQVIDATEEFRMVNRARRGSSTPLTLPHRVPDHVWDEVFGSIETPGNPKL